MSQSKGNSHLGQAGKFPAIEARFLGRTAPASLPQGETTENQKISKPENAPESLRSDEQGGGGPQTPTRPGSALSLGEFHKKMGDKLITLEKKIEDGTATTTEINFYECMEKSDREQRLLYQENCFEIWTGQNEHELTAAEWRILKTLDNDTMRGEALLKKAKLKLGGVYKTLLSHMKKRGILRNNGQGYYRGEIEVCSRDGKMYYYKKISS